MIWETGDMFAVKERLGTNTVAFTANATITAAGRLVMGAGAALSVRNHYGGIDQNFGACLPGGFASRVVPDYHLALVVRGNDNVLAVQVKRHYEDPGDMDLTRCSLTLLKQWSERYEQTVVMNCPLIGRGGYGGRAEEVYRLVWETLGNASNIHVCKV